MLPLLEQQAAQPAVHKVVQIVLPDLRMSVAVAASLETPSQLCPHSKERPVAGCHFTHRCFIRRPLHPGGGQGLTFHAAPPIWCSAEVSSCLGMGCGLHSSEMRTIFFRPGPQAPILRYPGTRLRKSSSVHQPHLFHAARTASHFKARPNDESIAMRPGR